MSKRRSKFTTVSLPITLYNKIKKRIKNTGFTSVSSYVTYVMREIIAEKDSKVQPTKSPFTEEDEERVKERLRALGYIE